MQNERGCHVGHDEGLGKRDIAEGGLIMGDAPFREYRDAEEVTRQKQKLKNDGAWLGVVM